jgi:hypothetical protein
MRSTIIYLIFICYYLISLIVIQYFFQREPLVDIFKTKVATSFLRDRLRIDNHNDIHNESIKQHDDYRLKQNVTVFESSFSYMWYRGKAYHANSECTFSSNLTDAPMTVDSLTIGSQYNLDAMIGQVKSWATHPSVRFFWGATELDDADPECHEKFTIRQLRHFVDVCKWNKYHDGPLRPIRQWFPRREWFATGGKGVGWMCAQQRFAHAVGKVGRYYRNGNFSLPDFLFIQDDDTWIGMNQMLSFLRTRNQSIPFVSAGCMVLWPLHIVNFSFPYGGFGLVLNQLAISRLIRPLYCETTNASSSIWEIQNCQRIRQNLVGEQMAFQDGMSVSDIMDKHASMLPYRKFRRWNNDPGYCMLGDWILGYYINYYDIGSAGFDKGTDHFSRIDGSLGKIYDGEEGSCMNTGYDNCRISSTKYICHRLKPQEMHMLQMEG